MKTNNSLYNTDWINGKYYPEVEAYYFKEWKGYNMEPHFHNRIEIMYVIKGICKIEVEGVSFVMKNGDFILIDAEINHKLVVEPDDSCRMLNIEFVFKEKESIFPSFNDLFKNTTSIKYLLELKQKYIILKDSDEVYNAMKNLIIELDGKSEDGEFCKDMFLAEIFIKLSILNKEMNEMDNSIMGVYTKKAIRYIYNHYYDDISVEDIASFINVHPNYLHRIFKKSTGSTIIHYLNLVRIEKAKMLLSNTNIKVSDVTNYIGINSVQYFVFLFRKITGTTPLKYRASSNKHKES